MLSRAVMFLVLGLVFILAAADVRAQNLDFQAFVYDPSFSGGVYTAQCGPDYLNRFWLVVGPGAGGGPHVKAFAAVGGGDFALLYSWFAYSPTFTGGVRVSCVVDFDGIVTVVTVPGAGGGPHAIGWSLP